MPNPTTLLDLVGVYENVLDIETCNKLIKIMDNIEKSDQLEQVRTETHVNLDQINLHRYSEFEPLLPKLIDTFSNARERYFNDTLPECLSLSAVLEPLRIKRYQPNGIDSFPHHIDATDVASATRYLVMFIYLNDVEEGGETVFDKLGARIKPKAGSIVMFPPMWMYPHAGEKPISGKKYILSTYLRFWDPSSIKTK